MKKTLFVIAPVALIIVCSLVITIVVKSKAKAADDSNQSRTSSFIEDTANIKEIVVTDGTDGCTLHLTELEEMKFITDVLTDKRFTVTAMNERWLGYKYAIKIYYENGERISAEIVSNNTMRSEHKLDDVDLVSKVDLYMYVGALPFVAELKAGFDEFRKSLHEQ